MTNEERPLSEMLAEARELSWSKFGKRLVCYIPGMFTYFNELGGPIREWRKTLI